MGHADLTVRATTSGGLQFRLLQGTAPVDLSAYSTIELHLRDASGGTSLTDSATGQLSVNGAAGGSVLWTPGTATLNAGSAPYQAYFKAYNSGTTWVFFPEDSEFEIAVRETF